MPTLGETFRSARDAKRVKLAQVAETTKIPAERLQALEADRYGDLSDDVYTRGAIRNYAIYLGLQPGEMEALYRQARPALVKQAPLSTVSTRRGVAVVPVAATVFVLVVLLLIALVALHVIIL